MMGGNPLQMMEEMERELFGLGSTMDRGHRNPMNMRDDFFDDFFHRGGMHGEPRRMMGRSLFDEFDRMFNDDFARE